MALQGCSGFSAEYFMPDPVHSICKKNPAGYAGRNHAFRVYAQEIQVRAGEESISLSAHSTYNPVNCGSTVSRRQDTEYGNGLTIMGYDYRTGSHSFSYSQISGIKASVFTDTIQMVFLLLVCAIFVPWALKLNGGTAAIQIAGASGEYGHLFSEKGLEVFLGFGLPTAIGLFAGPFGDQCFWQRAFSIRKDRIGRSFGLGAVMFAVVPLSMGILGFIASGTGFIPADTGMVNFELIKAIFPAWVIIPFMFMLISGLLSTVDSNLCAIASLTTDLKATARLKDADQIKVSKASMIVLLIVGILIANIPGLTVTHMFLFYCTLRATTMLPTMLTLMNVRLTASGVVAGVLTAFLVGLPILPTGRFPTCQHIKQLEA